VEPWRVEDAGSLPLGGVHAVQGSGSPAAALGGPVWAAAVIVERGDTVGSGVARGRAESAYRPGYLALVWGSTLETAVRELVRRPDVLFVDATGRDHPRRGGLALHLGWALDIPTIGVTDRSLVATADEPGPERGDAAPLLLEGAIVGWRLGTRRRARAVVVHAAWRTDPDVARAVVLAATGPRARTPEPLRRARRLARIRRAVDEGRLSPDLA
jgi:deoxyribonuclease V